MDWKLLIIGALLTLGGGFIMWRFRASRFNKELAAGCIMSTGVLLTGLGLLTFLFGFFFKA